MTPWDEPIVSIVLAGGRGTRMQSDTKHKVCFEVGGVPIILRALRVYQQCGVDQHIIVVGILGEQVLHTVGTRVPNVSFAYQPEPLGTGNAAKCGAAMLQATGYDGLVLVVVGDRIVAPHIVHRLMTTLRDSRSDVVFLCGHKDDNRSSGRVVFDSDGNAAAIVETSEIALSSLVTDLEGEAERAEGGQAPCSRIIAHIRTRFANDNKARKACGELYTQAMTRDFLPVETLETLLEPLRATTTLTIWIDGIPRRVRAAEAENMTTQANISAYLFRAPVLYKALETLSRDNAQGEEFMTDCIKNLSAIRHENGSPVYWATTVCVDQPDDSMSFNTPEELADIERKLRADGVIEREADVKVAPQEALQTAGRWRELLETGSPQLQGFLDDTYGPVPELHQEKRAAYIAALDKFIATYGANRPVHIVRSPGRVNLMGRHVDHRGGNTNIIAISEEIIMVAAPREDDTISLCNTRGDIFESKSFSIAQDIANLEWTDWMTCVNSPKTLAMVSNGDWVNYVRAAALRLQAQYRRMPLRGADIVTHGTIPIASGLSSSSAVVVGTAEVLVAVNGLMLKPDALVDLCAEGEWFVGTRGGSTDHAAIKFGRRGLVAHASFFPFEILEFLPFFTDHCVVVCNSGLQAKKSLGARSMFNKRVLGYEAGELIIKQMLPEFSLSIHHLRDFTCENLGIELHEIYEIIRQLPNSITRREFTATYGPFSPEVSDRLNSLFATLSEGDDSFEVRGVILYGLAEIERARRCVEYLRAGDVDGFGVLCYLSHDGDRIVAHDADLNPVPWKYEVTDEYLSALAADARSDDPQRVARAQLHLQPGKYACSTETIDRIVDIAKTQPGVVGAQLVGAGLGGCVIALVRNDACDRLIETYDRHGFEAKRYFAVEGASRVALK